MSHSGGGQAADRTPFYGIKLPVEVKKLVQLFKVVERSTMKQVLKGVWCYAGGSIDALIA